MLLTCFGRRTLALEVFTTRDPFALSNTMPSNPLPIFQPGVLFGLGVTGGNLKPSWEILWYCGMLSCFRSLVTGFPMLAPLGSLGRLTPRESSARMSSGSSSRVRSSPPIASLGCPSPAVMEIVNGRGFGYLIESTSGLPKGPAALDGFRLP